MHESEIQSPTSCILSGLDVMDTFLDTVSLPRLPTNEAHSAYLVCHGLPLSISTLILENIVKFREKKQSDRKDVDDDQVPVSTPVEWLIVLTVDVRSDDATALYHHIV
jgi:hypothetical protein